MNWPPQDQRPPARRAMSPSITDAAAQTFDGRRPVHQTGPFVSGASVADSGDLVARALAILAQEAETPVSPAAQPGRGVARARGLRRLAVRSELRQSPRQHGRPRPSDPRAGGRHMASAPSRGANAPDSRRAQSSVRGRRRPSAHSLGSTDRKWHDAHALARSALLTARRSP